MKINNKGFMFTEVVIVATIVCVTLIIIYTQFTSVYSSYKERARYENAESLYYTAGLKKIIEDVGINWFIVELGEDNYTNISQCEGFDFLTDYCEEYKSKTGINAILFTKDDLTNLKSDIDNNLNLFNRELGKYVSHQASIQEVRSEGYRLILEFANGNYATMRVG